MPDRAIVTVVGRNRIGVLSEVTTEIANMNGNIMDISQKMMGDFFNLIMSVEISDLSVGFSTFKERLEKLGEEKGYKVSVQHEDVFLYMHRI